VIRSGVVRHASGGRSLHIVEEGQTEVVVDEGMRLGLGQGDGVAGNRCRTQQVIVLRG
jgi:hypothetical protein